MFTGTVTLRWSAGNLNHLSDDLYSCIRDNLDILEMEEREKVVKHIGLTFKLHPLVIVNISDHYSRVKSRMHPPVTNTSTPPAPNNSTDGAVEAASSSSFPDSSSAFCLRVFSCVIGVQRGCTVEIFNSFELLYNLATHCLDRAFLAKKQELYKKVFLYFYKLGWYSTGIDAQEFDMNIHKALMDINENPVYVLLNPLINVAHREF
ncbi:unnamed protein product [Malus baccata var. baccata]